MRWLLGITAVLVTLWCGYWAVGERVIEREARAALARMVAGGKEARVEDLWVQGFPNRFDLMATGLHLADPARGLGWQTGALQIYSMTWKPWHLIAALPQPQTLTLPGQSLTLTGTGTMASLRARPAADLPLAEARLAGQALALRSDAGWSLGAAALTVALRADPDQPRTYALGAEATGIAPDPALLAALAELSLPGLAAPDLTPPDLTPPDLPPEIARARADLRLRLTAPLDRHAGDTRPQLDGLAVTEIALDWGPLTLRASGEVARDAQGLAAGRLDIRITGWDRLPALLVAMGALPAERAPLLASMLAAGAAGQEVLTLPLTFDGGQMRLGPLPLGPAPRLSSGPG